MKHKSYLFFIAALLIAVVALFVYMACTAQQTDGEYISFTASRLIGSDELEATIYEYDIKSKKISEVYRFPVSAMYSLGIFDKKSNPAKGTIKRMKENIWAIRFICTI